MSGFRDLGRASGGRAAALAVRFILELALLAGAAFLVWRLVPHWWRWPVSILAVVAVAVVWGLFLSPKAAVASPPAVRLVVEAALFLAVGAGLCAIGVWSAGVLLVCAWILDRAALALLQR